SILGEEYFLDHVHPTIEIHQQLALWILETLHSERWLSGEKVSPAQIEETDQRVRSKIDVAAQGIALRNLTKVLHWSGKFQEAIPCARGALDRVPDDPESLLLLADCLCRTDETNEAIVRCERLLEIDPTYASGYLVYGELLLRQEDYERAEEVLLFATVMLPPESDSLLRARYLLGVTYLMKGQFEEADRLLTEIHQIYPDDLETLDYLAQTKAGLRETDVAIGLYEQIIGQSPNRTDTLQRLGLLFLQERRANDAKRCFDWVIKLDPGNEQALSQRNIALQLLGGQSASRDVANGQREN
ncbi:MAG: tetratricopeptide repeat protein, partial [Planctomycetota bacterium]